MSTDKPEEPKKRNHRRLSGTPKRNRTRNQPESLAENQHKTNITGVKRGPYIFDMPDDTDPYSRLVKAMMEMSNEYRKYQETHQYESYRKTRTWLRTIRKFSTDFHSHIRLDYIDYTNKDVDDD